MGKKRHILRLIVLGVIFAALGTAFYTAYVSDSALVKVGEEAPDFTLTNLEGEQVNLSDFRGQGVFINFWASWCNPCKAEMPDIEKQYQLMKDLGIVVLAVNIEESHLAVSTFVKRNNLSFPVLLDVDKSVTNRYGVGPIPTSFFIDKDGIVVSKIERMMNERQINHQLQEILPE